LKRHFLPSQGRFGFYELRNRRLMYPATLWGRLPELYQAAQQRFFAQPPKTRFWEGQDGVEVRDADDFDPWDTLRWETVRVTLYRQHKPHGTVFEAFWLTDFTTRQLSSRSLFPALRDQESLEDRESRTQ
jgi:hypothetical protein